MTTFILIGTILIIGVILYVLWVKRSGATALHLAACHDEIETMLSLLMSGKSPNAKDRSGRTPLHQAIMSGSPASVDILLEAGADPNIRDKYGCISLHHVVSRRERSGTHKIILSLLQHGADPNIQNIFGEIPYAQALRLDRDLIANVMQQETQGQPKD